jgi:hypothetical protein
MHHDAGCSGPRQLRSYKPFIVRHLRGYLGGESYTRKIENVGRNSERMDDLVDASRS